MIFDEMIDIIKAAKLQRGIQFRTRGNDKWIDCTPPIITFNFQDYEYQIKPEPLELWINVYNGPQYRAYHTREEADAATFLNRVDCIKFREVMDETKEPE